MIVQPGTTSPSGEVQWVHKPAKQNTPPPATGEAEHPAAGKREMQRSLRLARILGPLPLVPAVGEDQAAIARARDEAAVGRPLVDGLDTRVDHREARVEPLRPVRHQPPAQLLDAPPVAVVDDGKDFLRGCNIEAPEALLRWRGLDAERFRQPRLDVIRPARLERVAATHDRPPYERGRSDSWPQSPSAPAMRAPSRPSPTARPSSPSASVAASRRAGSAQAAR
jgi:hypothetical protein